MKKETLNHITDELLREYCSLGYSTRKIMELTNASYGGIRNKLKKFGLKTDYNMGGMVTNKKERVVKNCKNCEKELTGNRSLYCSRTCSVAAHYKEKHGKEKVANKRIDRKITCVKILGGSCKNCGYDKNLGVLSFHHIDPSTKSFELNSNAMSSNSMEEILTELNKCILLCHNCHVELHQPHLTDWKLVPPT